MISYARWFTNDTGEDRLLVELSNNFGVSWVPVESVAGATNWQQRFIRVADFIPPTNITRIRFSVADDPNNSRAEAALDAVMVFNVTCPEPAACRKGDVNQDGRIDGQDVDLFVELLTGGGTPGSASYCAADLNGDTEVTLVDSQLLTDCLILGNCP
ncbi:MAG: dockerin type I repeat-containing protein [Planctomycetes bacterium]|nr:dockerin type I repeat-containing protein [Planctomycetota bacterium]